MMYALLRQLHRLPVTPAAVEVFLNRAARLMIIGEITADDWKYLLRLLNYKVQRYVLKGER